MKVQNINTDLTEIHEILEYQNFRNNQWLINQQQKNDLHMSTKYYQNGRPFMQNQQYLPKNQPLVYANNAKPKKHSGAKKTIYTPVSGPNKGVEQHLTTGWRLNRNGELISVKCVTTEKSVLSDKGWYGSIAVTFTNTTTGASYFHWGTMQKSTGKVVVDKLAIVLNPKANDGGYCGTYLRKK